VVDEAFFCYNITLFFFGYAVSFLEQEKETKRKFLTKKEERFYQGLDQHPSAFWLG